MEKNLKRGPLTVGGALLALAGAAALTVAFYFVVGFPANVPAAVGVAVLLAEVIEAGRSGESGPTFQIGRALFHAVLAALASWLGVAVARLMGWLG